MLISVILAAEVTGYERLVADDAEETQRRLKACRAAIDRMIAAADGHLLGTAPEVIRAEFQDTRQAVRCALAIQDDMRARNAAYPPSRQIRFRVGIASAGIEATQRHVAPGGIGVSDAVREAIAGELPVRFASTPDADVFRIEMRREDGNYDSPRVPALPKPDVKTHWGLPLTVAIVGAFVIAGGAMIYQVREDLKRITGAQPTPSPQPNADSAFDASRLSWLADDQRIELANEYTSAASSKALSLSAAGRTYMASGQSSTGNAVRISLEACRAAGDARCVTVAEDDRLAVTFPRTARAAGIFQPEKEPALAASAREDVARRIAKSSGGWTAVAAGTKGLPGIALDAPSENDATAGALEACGETDKDCRLIAIGPFAVQPN